MGETSRIKLYNDFRNDASENEVLSEFDKKYPDFSSWESKNFTNPTTVKGIWNKSLKNILNPVSLSDFYSKFVCDLSWAKETKYCGGSEGGNTNTSNYEIQWSKYPCVVELAKSKGASLDSVGAYLIGDFKYFANGRKGILSTGKVTDFTCNDPEFKTLSSGSQSTQIPSELKDIDGVKKFQDWLDINHPGWHKKYGTLNKNLLRGYGKYGPNTNRAWNSYKDEYLKTSNSTATPSSESPSNWMDSFPSCVKGLKGFYNPPNNYFFGFGTDKEGTQYMIGYYSQKFNTGQRCEIYKDGSSVGNGFYSCTTNNQQIIIKTLSGLSITGSVINPDSKDITLPKNDNETLEPSDDDVLKDNKVRVSKNTGI
jgi:hypothetical protein